jgi:hypothetical protein
VIGQRCIALDWGLRGVIQNDLGDHWGIYWTDVPPRIIAKFGYPNYWQKKHDITILKDEITVNIAVADKPINEGDLFFYRQSDGTPSFRIAKKGEHWNGFFNSKTGEPGYFKVINIKPL